MTVRLGDKDWQMSPIDFEILERIEMRFKSRLINAAAEAITPDMEQRVIDAIMKGAVERASKINLLDEEVRLDIFRQVTGVRAIFYECAIEHHPMLTWKQACELVQNGQDLMKVNLVFQAFKQSGDDDDADENNSGNVERTESQLTEKHSSSSSSKSESRHKKSRKSH